MMNLEQALAEIEAANKENRRAMLRSADLCGSDLRYSDLRSANLSGADLRGADLSGANLRGANLSGADLCGSDLRYSDLRSANLSGADLRGANLSGADLRGANLSGANLSGANLRGAKLNWNDHHVISHLLYTHAQTIEQKLWSAWLGKETGSCHIRLFATVHKHAPDVLAWAMPLMQSWIKEGDNAPGILKNWTPESVPVVEDDSDDDSDNDE